MADILRPTLNVRVLEAQVEKAKEKEAKRQEEARRAAAARKDDRGSLNLELALLIALLVLVAVATLLGLGYAVAEKYEQAARMDAAAISEQGPEPKKPEMQAPLPAGTLVVRVQDRAGKPVSGAHVIGPYAFVRTTGPDGFVSWDGLEPGTYQLAAYAAMLGHDDWISVSLGSTQGTSCTITLKPTGGTLTVRVFDADGNPVEGRSVGFVGWPYLPAKTTGPDGTVSFPELSFSRYAMVIPGTVPPVLEFDFAANNMTLNATVYW